AREAEALRRLEHARVVRFLEHGEDAGVAYIVTELVRGRDLAATLVADKLTLARVIDVFGQVCDGVAAAHAAGIVHRDLKPANILVGEDGAVKVADFGLAQLGPDAAITTLTRTDVAMGTFHYLAPEQRKDAHGIDHRADVWALGVIFYEMLTGELPLGSFAPPSVKGPAGCDRRADAIVRRALAPDPNDRFATVAELGKAVRALAPRPARRRAFALAAAAVMLAAGTAGAIAMTSGDDDTPDAVAMTSDPGRVAIAIDAAPARELAAVDASVPEPVVDLPVDAAVVLTPVAPPKPKPKPKPPTKPRPVKSKSVDDDASFGGSGAPPSKGKTVKRPEPKPPVKVATAKPTLSGSGADSEPFAGSADGGSASEGKSRVSKPEPPMVCRAAYRCCYAVKRKGCRLGSDAETCEAALGELRGLATNPKQRDACR
ncbi:MAG TPA: serine/threonine-protein kinase, partial [Kofleriaceae bacterium]